MHNKDIQWERVTADRKLADQPCWLHFAFLECISGSGAVHLHDGPDDASPPIVDLVTTSNEFRVFNPREPLYCKKGLFVDYDSGTSLTIQWELESHCPHEAPPPPARETTG